MKNTIFQLLLLIALIIGVGGAAQAASAYKLNIPFDFTVNGKLLKAGKYSINFGFSSSNNAAFLLRSANGVDSAIVIPAATLITAEKVDYVSAVFERKGNNYVLAEVYSPRTSVVISKEKSNPNAFRVIRISNK